MQTQETYSPMHYTVLAVDIKKQIEEKKGCLLYRACEAHILNYR